MEIMLGNFVDGGEAQLPPGFRFHPTDEELITYYLMKKVIDSGFTGRAIAEVDLNKCEPWELPGTYMHMLVSINKRIKILSLGGS